MNMPRRRRVGRLAAGTVFACPLASLHAAAIPAPTAAIAPEVSTSRRFMSLSSALLRAAPRAMAAGRGQR
jgi:hypothetical protein